MIAIKFDDIFISLKVNISTMHQNREVNVLQYQSSLYPASMHPYSGII